MLARRKKKECLKIKTKIITRQSLRLHESMTKRNGKAAISFIKLGQKNNNAILITYIKTIAKLAK